MSEALDLGLRTHMALMLTGECGVDDVAKVTGYQQYDHEGGACSTCHYTEIRVRIDYTTTAGDTDSYDFHGDMATLIRALTD